MQVLCLPVLLKTGPRDEGSENYSVVRGMSSHSPSVSSPMLLPSGHLPVRGLCGARTPCSPFLTLCNRKNSCYSSLEQLCVVLILFLAFSDGDDSWPNLGSLTRV